MKAAKEKASAAEHRAWEAKAGAGDCPSGLPGEKHEYLNPECVCECDATMCHVLPLCCHVLRAMCCHVLPALLRV